MVKLPRRGVAYQSLYERDPTGRESNVTLADVISSLGLRPLTAKGEREIRARLGFAIAKFEPPCPTFEQM